MVESGYTSHLKVCRWKSLRTIPQGSLACSAECQGGGLVQEVDWPCRAGSLCPLVRQNVRIQLLDQRLPIPEVPRIPIRSQGKTQLATCGRPENQVWPGGGGGGGSMTCKGCTGNIETQEHCLSMCTGNMQEMRKRHNAILERLVKAVPQTLGTKFLDQTVPSCGSLGRPDVVILDDKDKKTYLVDVAVPCETPENLRASRERKLDKYAGIKAKAKLEEKGYDTVLDVLLVGSLGKWDRENDSLLGKLCIGRKYQALFKSMFV